MSFSANNWRKTAGPASRTAGWPVARPANARWTRPLWIGYSYSATTTATRYASPAATGAPLIASRWRRRLQKRHPLEGPRRRHRLCGRRRLQGADRGAGLWVYRDRGEAEGRASILAPGRSGTERTWALNESMGWIKPLREYTAPGRSGQQSRFIGFRRAASLERYRA